MILAVAVLAGVASSGQAQHSPQVFQRVNASVVVVRAKGRDLVDKNGTSVLAKYNELGSGVLLSSDGKVITAAHVVQIAEEVTVEFLGGDSVPARVISTEPKADLALLQLARAPAGVQPATLGDSGNVQVGEQVFLVGARTELPTR